MPEPTIHEDHLIWIDLEMTGLKPESDVIIEIATVVTDKNLEVIAEGPNLAIHQPDEVLAGMDSVLTDLTNRVAALERRVNTSPSPSADADTAEHLRSLASVAGALRDPDLVQLLRRARQQLAEAEVRECERKAGLTASEIRKTLREMRTSPQRLRASSRSCSTR